MGGAGVVNNDVAAVVDGRGSSGGSTAGCGAADERGGVLVGFCCLGLAADGGYSTISMDDGATVVSDVARVVGPLVGSEGVSGAADGRGVAPEGVASSVWAAYGRFSSDSADGAATVVSDVARVVGFLGGSSGGWDASRGVVNELRGTGMHCGGAGRCSGVDEVGRAVVVVVDVVVDGCVVALDVCDVGCDEGVGGEVSVGKTEGLGSGMSWSVGLGVIPFLGHSFSNASQRCSQVSFCVAGRALHHRSA